MKKENLILVHSFPTNSIILKGFIERLNEDYIVYFIDLPGFNKDIPKLRKISIENYAKYIDKKIKEFNLKHYIIGGISFGFDVINRAKLNKNCRGIVGIEPFIDTTSLRISEARKIIYKAIINIVTSLNLYSKVWKSRIMRKLYSKNMHIVLEQINPVAFFDTAKIIFHTDKPPKFHRHPYILLINPHDGVIKINYIRDIFKKAQINPLIIKTTVSHYPKDLSRQYFEKNIPPKIISQVNSFLS